MSGHEQDTDIRDSTPNSTGPARAAGGMGVSSERVGHAGPGQEATDGVKDTSRIDAPNDEALRLGVDGPVSDSDPDPDSDPEESDTIGRDRLRRSDEPRPDGLDPAAGYPSLDPRSKDKPYKDA
jgi:hypothetical protein